jgi:linoleoyl-CoA desaturase
MTENEKFSDTSEKTDFHLISQVLKQRIDDYFHRKKVTRHFNSKMVVKIVFGILFWGATYFAILQSSSALTCIIFFSIHGLSHVFLGLCIGHDASHHGTFRKSHHNKILSVISFDFLTGVNSYRWHLAHNASHHPNINVRNMDPNLEVTSLLRLTPHQTRTKMHFYQHIYGSFLYLFLMLVWVVYNDLKFFIVKPRVGVYDKIKIPVREYFLMIIAKAFYVSYMIIIPIYLIDIHWVFVIIGFISMQFISGFLVAFILQVSHIQEELHYPQERTPGATPEWIRSIVNSTIDYGINHKVFTWFFGALNLHTIHHLHPNICHVHYHDLSLILSETLQEYGVDHDGKLSPMEAYKLHLKSLKYFGRND